MSDQGSQDRDDADDRVNIDYIKGTLFRTISPSGVIGSLTPQGFLQIGLFSERQAIPQRVTYRVSEDGELGDVIDSVGRNAIVREMDAVVTLDPMTAGGLVVLLTDLLNDLRNVTSGGDDDAPISPQPGDKK